ncbi:MAG TPA: hypothetical protein VFT78_06805 [Hanamia sp.]|nr:hypothetical protein [Hanamia sp.]
MASAQQNKDDPGKVLVQRQIEIVIDVIEPPPPHLVSNFATMQDWLLNICERDKPQKPISKYAVGLFESLNDYTLFLIGMNTYDEDKHRSEIRIEFEPTNMYFKLHEGYFQNLSREQLLEKLTSDLKDFAKTVRFKTSFFSKATSFVFETNGHTIWSKQ